MPAPPPPVPPPTVVAKAGDVEWRVVYNPAGAPLDVWRSGERRARAGKRRLRARTNARLQKLRAGIVVMRKMRLTPNIGKDGRLNLRCSCTGLEAGMLYWSRVLAYARHLRAGGKAAFGAFADHEAHHGNGDPAVTLWEACRFLTHTSHHAEH